MPQESHFPISESTKLSTVPAFSILVPENLTRTKKLLRDQTDHIEQLLETHDALAGRFGGLIFGFDYDVINDYMFPFSGHPNPREDPPTRQKRAARHARAKVLLDLASGNRFLPLGTILDIEQALAKEAADKGIWDLLETSKGPLDDKTATLIIERARELISCFRISRLSERTAAAAPPSPWDQDWRWMAAMDRLHKLLLGSGERTATPWKSETWHRDNSSVHRPVFRAVLDYLTRNRNKAGADIADALSIAQLVQLILKDRNGDLSVPPDRRSTEYLFVTNTTLLFGTELFDIVVQVLTSESKSDRPIHLTPFAISPGDFLATRFASDRPGARVTRNELQFARDATHHLRQSLIAASESPLWRDLVRGDHGCANVYELFEYVANMDAELPDAIRRYVELMETPLFKAYAAPELESVRAETQLVGWEEEPDFEHRRSEAERYLDCLEKMRQLNHFLALHFDANSKTRLGLEKEHFGLSEEVVGANHEETQEYRLVKRTGAATGKAAEPPSIWLMISREGFGESPVVRWRVELGPLESLVIAKRLEKALASKHPHFKVGPDATVVFVGEEEEVEIPVDTFAKSQAVYEAAIQTKENPEPMAVKSVECRFGTGKPVIAVGPDIENGKPIWMASLSEVDWTQGTPQDNAEWVAKAVQGSHLSSIHIPGVRKWIETTLAALCGEKE